MNCPSCNKEAGPQDTFCSSCGSKIIQSSEPFARIAIESGARSTAESSYFVVGNYKIKKTHLAIFALVVLVFGGIQGLANKGNEFSNNAPVQQNLSADNNSSNSTSSNSDANATLAPDPSTGVDVNQLPSGNEGTNEYYLGQQEAQSFIDNSGLTRAIYDQLGGLDQSCKFILDTFMALNGGASTKQQYADFLLGCAAIVKAWY